MILHRQKTWWGTEGEGRRTLPTSTWQMPTLTAKQEEEKTLAQFRNYQTSLPILEPFGGLRLLHEFVYCLKKTKDFSDFYCNTLHCFMWNVRNKKEIHSSSEQIKAGLSENLIKRKGRQRPVFSGTEGANFTKLCYYIDINPPSTDPASICWSAWNAGISSYLLCVSAYKNMKGEKSIQLLEMQKTNLEN